MSPPQFRSRQVIGVESAVSVTVTVAVPACGTVDGASATPVRHHEPVAVQPSSPTVTSRGRPPVRAGQQGAEQDGVRGQTRAAWARRSSMKIMNASRPDRLDSLPSNPGVFWKPSDRYRAWASRMNVAVSRRATR